MRTFFRWSGRVSGPNRPRDFGRRCARDGAIISRHRRAMPRLEIRVRDGRLACRWAPLRPRYSSHAECVMTRRSDLTRKHFYYNKEPPGAKMQKPCQYVADYRLSAAAAPFPTPSLLSNLPREKGKNVRMSVPRVGHYAAAARRIASAIAASRTCSTPKHFDYTQAF